MNTGNYLTFSPKKTIFVLMAMVYGLFSSSTPDKIGLAEFAIAICLVLLVGARGIGSAFTVSFSNRMNFIVFLRLGFIYFLFVPSAYGFLWGGVSIGDWLRDIIPLLYIFLVILIYPQINRDPVNWMEIISKMLVIIGCAFSIRYFMIGDVSIGQLGQQAMFGDLNYFPMDPAVTFAAIFSLLESFRALENRRTSLAVGWMLISLVCVASLAAMLVRAPLLLYGLIAIGRTLTMRKQGLTGLTIQTGFIIIFAGFAGALLPLATLIIEKFDAVGLNTKDAEFREIIGFAGSSVYELIFGTGWGGHFISPAYSAPVRFVHNLPGYFLLKTGIFGFLFGTYLVIKVYGSALKYFLMKRLGSYNSRKINVSVIGASLAVFSSSFFLQPNYKSLSFGLIFANSLIAMGMLNKQPSGSSLSPTVPTRNSQGF